ncbi:pentapeptide repeat-containing protein [Actinophytocola sp.]|uniref:pentapeptide repeat-containing protein n=1 Tax=Actinophytocola sp. TaxID=1872138 RepID=UPI0038998B8E
MADDPRPPFEPWWPLCAETDCRGVQAVADRCLAHATDLSTLEPGADLDLRGVVIDSAKFAEIRGRFRDHEAKRFVHGRVQCDFTWFSGRAWFDETDINGPASFRNAYFGYLARFDGVRCADKVSFVDARFPGTALMWPMTADRIDMERAWFASRVEIRGQIGQLRCVDTRFEAGVVLVAFGEVDAAGAYFGAPSTFSWMTVTSLDGADVSNLVLAEVDLSDCEFLGAHRLEQLRIEGRATFAMPDGRWRTRRRMLAEEKAERSSRVGAAYRALRRSFEDSRFEAGAGDFYYGEMECRRHSEESSRAERVILWFYWLLSGYGQRASRALIALVLVIAVVTGLLTVWGQDFGTAARTALGAVVFRDDKADLTAAAEWTVLVARFLGPVLLALAVLAIRARVKR